MESGGRMREHFANVSNKATPHRSREQSLCNVHQQGERVGYCKETEAELLSLDNLTAKAKEHKTYG